MTHALTAANVDYDTFQPVWICTPRLLVTRILNAQMLYITSKTLITDILQYQDKLTCVVCSSCQDHRMAVRVFHVRDNLQRQYMPPSKGQQRSLVPVYYETPWGKPKYINASPVFGISTFRSTSPYSFHRCQNNAQVITHFPLATW
jgi:hypothetical protein